MAPGCDGHSLLMSPPLPWRSHVWHGLLEGGAVSGSRLQWRATNTAMSWSRVASSLSTSCWHFLSSLFCVKAARE